MLMLFLHYRFKNLKVEKSMEKKLDAADIELI